MENTASILLYSKYSSNCQEITNMIRSSPTQLPFKFLCADNKEVRQRIKDNKKIDVNYLPCILNVHSNGAVEQYEGPQAFNVVKNILASIQQPIPPENKIHSVEKEDYQDDTPPAPKQRVMKRRPPPVQRPHRKEQKSMGETSIDDLPDDDDDDEGGEYMEDDEYMEGDEQVEYINKPIRKPRRRIRSNVGNFDEQEGEDYDPPEHNMNGHREVRTTTDKNIKDDQSNISMKAQELAKEREQSDSQFKPRGAAIPSEMRRE